MKTSHFPQSLTLTLIACFFSLSLFSATPCFNLADDENPVIGLTFQNFQDETPQFELRDPRKPAKKKSRKCCPAWRPTRLFQKGQLDAIMQAGLIPTYFMDGAKMKLPPVSLGVDYRFNEHFSLGASVAHSISESKPTLVSDGFLASWKNSATNISLRPAVHITTIEDWDFYGGFAIGLNITSINGKSEVDPLEFQKEEEHRGIKPDKTSASFYGFTGVRRVVAPKWTVNAEVGFGISIVTIGTAYLLH